MCVTCMLLFRGLVLQGKHQRIKLTNLGNLRKTYAGTNFESYFSDLFFCTDLAGCSVTLFLLSLG